ncbi:MAG: UDP-N-acetylmuramoyl-L-alanyl-D-glutamate--2,6-diaminopimelate ligase, partial [Deltaproteobacteria bacterium]|nr:UDP-N-acetylmuramoyl-L-alanyl-D-glutamate--2,6-diaminopimelate ligase [Deltaproteobacteria bacterium]
MAKFLTELLAGIPWHGCQKNSDLKVKVSGLSSDSREIGPGMVFVALTGLREDGHQYIAQARA